MNTLTQGPGLVYRPGTRRTVDDPQPRWIEALLVIALILSALCVGLPLVGLVSRQADIADFSWSASVIAGEAGMGLAMATRLLAGPSKWRWVVGVTIAALLIALLSSYAALFIALPLPYYSLVALLASVIILVGLAIAAVRAPGPSEWRWVLRVTVVAFVIGLPLDAYLFVMLLVSAVMM